MISGGYGQYFLRYLPIIGKTCAKKKKGRNTMENVVYQAPIAQRKTNKGLLKTILLSVITFGIYPLVVMSAVSDDVNAIASR